MAMAAFTCKVARRALVVRVAAAPALWRSKARGFKHGPARLVRRQEEVELCICMNRYIKGNRESGHLNVYQRRRRDNQFPILRVVDLDCAL